MTDKAQDPAADIAWMRRLAEEGDRAPMRGASILMVAGLIYGLTSLLHWGHAAGLVPSAFGAAGIEWLLATGLFLIVIAVILWRLRRAVGVRTAANRAIGTIWSGVGWGIFVLFLSMAVVSARVGVDQGSMMFWLVPSIIMAFYGMGWAVTAAMLKARPLAGLAVASFLAAPALAAFSGQDAQYLAYAAALLLLMAAPGFLLMRAAARADRA
jgi:hypothetical protein